MDKRPTIKDVAAHAGVSKSTVSLVVQNSALVKQETREVVQASMQALNYVRNRAAATLRGSSTGLIGLVINDLRNPFFTEFATSAQMTFSERGYATVVANSDEDPAIQRQVIASMLEHDVSALLISPSYGDNAETFEAIARAGVPSLQVLRQVETPRASLPFFSHDYEGGSALAADHLLDQGLDRIAFVGGLAGREITDERRVGYLTGMAERNRPPLVFDGRPTRAFGRAAAFALLRDHPDVTAAICFNDLVALGMHAALAEAGRRLGEDFYLVGFDDIEEASLVYPALTSVRCDVVRFGGLSAGRLIDWIELGTPPDPVSRLPVSLKVRASSIRK